MTRHPDTNTSQQEEWQAAVEALAVWHRNRQARAIKGNGGAASWFHECLPTTQENYRDWASHVLELIAAIKGPL